MVYVNRQSNSDKIAQKVRDTFRASNILSKDLLVLRFHVNSLPPTQRGFAFRTSQAAEYPIAILVYA